MAASSLSLSIYFTRPAPTPHSFKQNNMTLALTLSFALAIITVVLMIDYTQEKMIELVSAESSIRSDGIRTRHCDRDICDSLVSKCTLSNRCHCDFRRDARCAKACIDCLEEKFGKCCACVGLCPDVVNDLYSSHVGDTSASDRQLFEVLTETDDIKGRWRVETRYTGFQVSRPELGQIDGTNSTTLLHHEDPEKLKCTVAFINRHLSMTKCKKSCTSMGANYFRWFHDGCCECVGEYCLNYGIDEPGCIMQDDLE